MPPPDELPLLPGVGPSEAEIRSWLEAAATAAYGPARAAELGRTLDGTVARLARLARLGPPPPDREPDLGR